MQRKPKEAVPDYIDNAIPGPAVGRYCMSVSRASLPAGGAPMAGQFRHKKRQLEPRSTAGKCFLGGRPGG